MSCTHDSLIDICFNATHRTFAKDLDVIIAAAYAENVRQMIIPGSSLHDSRNAIELCQQYPERSRVAAGIHPHLAREWNENSSKQLYALTRNPKVVAVGETGLDYQRNFSPPDTQRAVFAQHINIAVETGLPLFLHQRDAHRDLMALIKPRRDELTGAVVHCFTGNEQQLEDYIELDFYIGITGWICDERRGSHLKDIVPKIPEYRLLLETDAPYLLPRSLPQRPQQNRNEPRFLPHIAQQVAMYLNKDITELAVQTSANAQRLFGWNFYTDPDKPALSKTGAKDRS